MSDSLREVSKIQAQDGTTIDGNRVDRVLDDLVGATNSVPARNVQRRFTQTQFVQRLFPVSHNATTAVQSGPPFLNAYNSVAPNQAIAPLPEDGFMNAYRHKGIDNPNIVEQTSVAGQGAFAWTNTLYFRDPVVLWGFDVKLGTSVSKFYLNDFLYHMNIGDYVNNDPSDDLYIEISVDNPFSTERAALHDPEVKKMRFRIDSATMAATLAAPTNDFTPNIQTDWGAHAQPWIHFESLNIPLHRDSRVRISIGVPQYSTAVYANASGWQGAAAWQPWQSCYWSATTTVLEPCRRA